MRLFLERVQWHSRSAEHGRLVRLPLALSWAPKTFIECNKPKELCRVVAHKTPIYLLRRAFFQLFNARQHSLQTFAQIADILFDVREFATVLFSRHSRRRSAMYFVYV